MDHGLTRNLVLRTSKVICRSGSVAQWSSGPAAVSVSEDAVFPLTSSHPHVLLSTDFCVKLRCGDWNQSPERTPRVASRRVTCRVIALRAWRVVALRAWRVVALRSGLGVRRA